MFHHVSGRGEVHVVFCLEYMRERDQLEDLSLDGKIMLEWTSKQSSERARIVFIWLGIRTSGGFL